MMSATLRLTREGVGMELRRGRFEISVDGQLRFSKKALGRFPTDEEIDALATG